MPKIVVNVGSATELDPVEFELHGFDAEHKPIKPVAFQCIPELQGTEFTRIFSGDSFEAGRATLDLIGRVIVKEQQALWNEIVNGNKIIVSLEALGEIAKGLIEVYSGNPTSAPAGSTPGSQPIRATSLDAYLTPPDESLRPSQLISTPTAPSQ